MRCLFAMALVTCLAGQVSPALAYAATMIITSIRLGTSCTPLPAARSTRSTRRNAVMVALAFQSITVGRARIMVSWLIGTEGPLRMALVLRYAVARRLRIGLDAALHRLRPQSAFG
jgi:hypothetical protein